MVAVCFSHVLAKSTRQVVKYSLSTVPVSGNRWFLEDSLYKLQDCSCLVDLVSLVSLGQDDTIPDVAFLPSFLQDI